VDLSRLSLDGRDARLHVSAVGCIGDGSVLQVTQDRDHVEDLDEKESEDGEKSEAGNHRSRAVAVHFKSKDFSHVSFCFWMKARLNQRDCHECQMVNTFLVHPDYRISASYLDWRRLGKQRVEAQQILTCLEHFDYLADFFGVERYPRDVDTPKEQRVEYVKSLMKVFKAKCPFGLIVCPDGSVVCPDGRTIIEENGKARSGKKIVELDDGTYKCGQTIYRYVYDATHVLIGTGFKSHPCVLSWMGFQDSLKEYIDSCVAEWVSRGYKNTMRTYGVVDAPRPSWTLDERIFDNHRGALFLKEMERNESPWYVGFPEFHSFTPFEDYIWP